MRCLRDGCTRDDGIAGSDGQRRFSGTACGNPVVRNCDRKNQRIVAANIGALTLVGWQAVGMNYISLLRQAALLHSVEAT